jgi:NAD(P)-dependent dehydrogenase (short-subunit alcohol dehydrogenase family)
MVTGASRGIGYEFARQYAADGWDVIATCRNPEGSEYLYEIARKYDGRITVERLDVLDFGSIEALAEKLKDQPIDILINNAGIMGPRRDELALQSFGTMDYEIWTRILRTNIFGPMRVAECFVGNVEASEKKMIANVSSRIGSNSVKAPVFAYGTSKAGLNKVTTLMAEVLRERGISVVALCPGHVKTHLGGVDAKIEPLESINGMRKIMEEITIERTGEYINYEGNVLPF